MSFKPDEITPEKAMEVAQELCHRLLQEQYQYDVLPYEVHDKFFSHYQYAKKN